MRKYNTDPEYKKIVDEDKRERAKAARKADPPLSLFDIVIPLAPFGIPGELRFCSRHHTSASSISFSFGICRSPWCTIQHQLLRLMLSAPCRVRSGRAI